MEEHGTVHPDKEPTKTRVYGRAPCPTCNTNKRVICWMTAGVYKCNGCGFIGWAYQVTDETGLVTYTLGERVNAKV